MPTHQRRIPFLFSFVLSLILLTGPCPFLYGQVGGAGENPETAKDISLQQIKKADEVKQVDTTEAASTAVDEEPAQAGGAAVAEGTEGVPTSAEAIAQGKTLFQDNCTVCHAVHEQVVGPALANVTDRRPIEWIINFVHNSQKVIQSGDEYAVNLYNEFNKMQMPNHQFLSEDQILSIMAYIQAETNKGPATAPGSGQEAAGTGTVATTTGGGIPSSYITAIAIGFIIVLILILIVLFLLVTVLSKYLKTKEGLDKSDREIVEQKVNIKKVVKSRPFVFMVSFVFIAIVLKSVIDGLYTIGLQEGYAPTQPIAFSHKLHAGKYQIDCNYCHTGVRKSELANIPSPNICMNCHSIIKNVGDKEGVSPEIQKIYDAIENNEPIEWVRVHKLPDLAYFNHAQHVAVGQVECQTCHGPVEEMVVMRVHAPLTMGWCIDCHKETQINTDNDYYAKLAKLHAEHSKEPMTVEDIGGLECAKCHY